MGRGDGVGMSVSCGVPPRALYGTMYCITLFSDRQDYEDDCDDEYGVYKTERDLCSNASSSKKSTESRAGVNDAHTL